jgi:hypothetical protein
MSEPTFTVELTRKEVLAILKDAQAARFPNLDSADETATFFGGMLAWWKVNRPAPEVGYADAATSYWAQIKDAHESSLWRTVQTSENGRDAAWGALTNEMETRGLRYSELAGHIDDMLRGEVLTAEDGTGFRILKPGQENTQ